MRRAVVCLVLVISGCADSTVPVDQQAHDYAVGISGGAITGCASSAEPANEPGCHYAAAFAGCLEGLTGEPPGALAPEVEFPKPELLEIYQAAVLACTPN